jgi:hypothetical protein
MNYGTRLSFLSTKSGEVQIEAYPFEQTEEQCFLIAYRALCHELYQKSASESAGLEMRDFVDRGMPEAAQREAQAAHEAFNAGVQKGLEDAIAKKRQMDEHFLNEAYSA